MLMTRVPEVDRSGGRNVPSAPSRWPSGMSFAVAVGCCAPVALLAWSVGAGVHPLAGLALFAVAAAGLAAVTGGLGTVGVVLLMWATDDGFVIHRFGVLSLDTPSVRAFAVIGGVALGAHGAAGLARRMRNAGSARLACQGKDR